MTTSTPQLVMVWPKARLAEPPTPVLPQGYRLRHYQPGDEARFYVVMALSGWPNWNDAKLQPWLARIPPRSWSMVVHEADPAKPIVATAMGLHDHTDWHPFGGELGWVASDPQHAGRGLGHAVCAAVTQRLIAAGYENIHLYTEHYRLPALKTYLKLGYVPHLASPQLAELWATVCEQLHWPYQPDLWATAAAV